jgi:acyl carrier protein
MIVRDEVIMVMSNLGFKLDELKDDATLQDLGVDSTELIEIIVALEKHFSININGTEDTRTSLGDLVVRVSELVSVSAAMKG